MNFSVIGVEVVIKMILLLLIGMGPKLALMPFLEKTQRFDAATQRAIGRHMVITAVITALILFATGALLMRLLHISPGAVAIGGAIVLGIHALKMVLGGGKNLEDGETPTDPMQLAMYPLAVPNLLNPVGITVLIIASREIVSIQSAVLVVSLVLLVGAFDYLVFTNIDRLSKRLNPMNLVISEVVFGILLMAVAVQLILFGFGSLGIIHLANH